MSLNEDFIRSVDKEDMETIKRFLQRGARVNYSDGYALSIAIKKLDIKLIELLLDFGADINQDEGMALVRFVNSAARNTLEEVRFLLSKGADATVRNNFPLYMAVQYDWTDMVRLLLENGAKPDRRSELGGYALRRENYEMMDLLIKYGYDINHKEGILLWFSTYNGKEAIRYLIYNGIRPDYLFLTNDHNEILIRKENLSMRLFIFNTYMSYLPLKEETTWDFWISWAPYLGDKYIDAAEQMKAVKPFFFTK